MYVVYTIGMKAILNIKTDPRLKKEAQKVAQEMGLPLSVVINESLKNFVEKREITFFAPLIPNARTARGLKKSIADINSGRTRLYGPFKSGKELIKSLRK